MDLYRKILHKTLLLSFLFTLTFCNNAQKEEKDANNTQGNSKDSVKTAENTKEDSKPKVQQPTDRKFNDIARMIAGLQPEEGSTMAKYCEDASWKQYAQAIDAQWKAVNKQKLPKMIEWGKQELKEPNAEKGTLFYPFSGADFFYAAVFFPEAEETVMMGLEPIGNMPDMEKISKISLSGYFGGIRRSLATILQYSFFKTNDMAVDFTGRVYKDLDGTLPTLLFFMARTDHKILFYEKIAIDPNGQLVKAEELKDAPKGTYYGTKIDYQRNDKPEERKTVYYFSVNLGNDAYDGKGGLKERKDLSKFIDGLNVTATYLKSASYLMYKPYFDEIKKLILKKSKYVLQDDSGMPVNNFQDGKWDLTFFGVYAGPIALFGNYYQNDMKKAYQVKEQVRPLPFGIGYQFREGSSNLMLAKKK